MINLCYIKESYNSAAFSYVKHSNDINININIKLTENTCILNIKKTVQLLINTFEY